eukprot:11166381-Karenia_brevis.AAC.1
MRTDANNLITTAQTTHLPEQKETTHQINVLRAESNSGSMDDLAHVASANGLGGPLTRVSANADILIKAVMTGVLSRVDQNPSFRELMKDKHRAYMILADWCVQSMTMPAEIVTCLGLYIQPQVQHCLSVS